MILLTKRDMDETRESLYRLLVSSQDDIDGLFMMMGLDPQAFRATAREATRHTADTPQALFMAGVQYGMLLAEKVAVRREEEI